LVTLQLATAKRLDPAREIVRLSTRPSRAGPKLRKAIAVAQARLDTTPAKIKPPRALIDAAHRQIPASMSGIEQGHPDGWVEKDGTVGMIAGVLAAQIRDAGHSVAAAEWAIHEFVEEGLLRVALRWPDRNALSELARDVADFDLTKPVPFSHFCVGSTPRLWEWWNEDSADAIAAGPVPPSGFRYRTRIYEALTPKQFALIEHLWKCEHRTARFQELAEPVWRDHARDVTNDMVGSLRREVNHFFDSHDIPFKIQIAGGKVSLREKI
jgi:hypothetical protein